MSKPLIERLEGKRNISRLYTNQDHQILLEASLQVAGSSTIQVHDRDKKDVWRRAADLGLEPGLTQKGALRRVQKLRSHWIRYGYVLGTRGTEVMKSQYGREPIRPNALPPGRAPGMHGESRVPPPEQGTRGAEPKAKVTVKKRFAFSITLASQDRGSLDRIVKLIDALGAGDGVVVGRVREL